MRKSGPAKPAYKATGKPAARKKGSALETAIISLIPAGRLVKGASMAVNAAKAAKAAKAAGKLTPGQKASLAKATATAKKSAAKVEKQAMKNIDKPVPKSNKPLGKITGVKSGGIKKPVTPQAGKYTGGRATANAAAAGKTMNTMKPLSATEKMFGSGRALDGVKTKKASEYTASNLNKIRTQQGTAREVAAAKKAEEIRKAKAVQRMLEINKKSGKFYQ